ncbi:hypothetical protein DOTSEDRAFT_70919 [Dothistroma septosporum NZE10]|uniref:Uncharacterized protein n=1 Tax=Dothistroma septosporum (strain NZE10 / CBS 128990) TaxID=675120 RepID=N1PRN5_DOTSN|nr:hypothetical protein DOTSEDRAFT_70919 [Dothistroma septosporum NZE10]
MLMLGVSFIHSSCYHTPDSVAMSLTLSPDLVRPFSVSLNSFSCHSSFEKFEVAIVGVVFVVVAAAYLKQLRPQHLKRNGLRRTPCLSIVTPPPACLPPQFWIDLARYMIVMRR